MIELYDYHRSSASFRVRIALHLKNIEYTKKEIHLVNNGGEQLSPEYEKINSQKLVPTLKDNEKIISQSLAIIEYLDETYGTPILLPKDPYEKAKVKAFALHIGADIHPLNNLRVINYLLNDLKISKEQKSAWYQHWIHKGFSALENELKKSSSYDYCFGNTPSLADIYLVPQMYNAKRFNCDLSDFPRLINIDAHCQQNPSFQKAWPNEPPVSS